MRGQAKAVDVIGILILIGTITLFLGIALPNFLDQIINEYVRASGEYIASEISGLATLLRAAENGLINYPLPPEDFVVYDIKISNRIIEVYPKFKKLLLTPERTRGINYLGVEVPERNFMDVHTEIKILKRGVRVSISR